MFATLTAAGATEVLLFAIWCYSIFNKGRMSTMTAYWSLGIHVSSLSCISLPDHDTMSFDILPLPPFLLEKTHSIIAIDQSQGMLASAKTKFPGVQFEKAGLQEMDYEDVFDGAICMDAMENVCPEDWPLVLTNFHRALKPHGYLYFTAETIENADEDEIRQAFDRAQKAGLPVVYGEFPDEEVYHYHPTNQQVREWVQQAGFEILKEANGEIWYYHILVRKV